jgi:hypothetical protein
MTDLRWDGAFLVQFFLCAALGRPAACAVGTEKKPSPLKYDSILIYNDAMSCSPHHPDQKGAHA